MEPVSGQKLGRYTLTRRLGAGGMAEVWEAADELLKRRVAVKIVRGALAESPEFSSRFLREARLAAQLQNSGIVAVFDVGLERDALFVVMPVLSGGSLSDRLPHPVDDGTAVAWLRTLASALDYAHAKGIVHRDVKPLNVLFDEGGSPHLSDFGLAKGLDEATQLTHTGMILGTPLYMSPEQAMGTAAGPAADQYSLGIVAYRLLAGRLPYEKEPTPVLLRRTVFEKMPPPSQFRRGLPPGVDAVFARVLAKTPEARFASCTAFVEALARSLHLRGGSLTSRLEPDETKPEPVHLMPAPGSGPPLRPAAERRTPPPLPPPTATPTPSAKSGRRIPPGLVLLGTLFAVLLGVSLWIILRPSDRPAVPASPAATTTALQAPPEASVKVPTPAANPGAPSPSPSSAPAPVETPFSIAVPIERPTAPPRPTSTRTLVPVPSPTPVPPTAPTPTPTPSPRPSPTATPRPSPPPPLPTWTAAPAPGRPSPAAERPAVVADPLAAIPRRPYPADMRVRDAWVEVKKSGTTLFFQFTRSLEGNGESVGHFGTLVVTTRGNAPLVPGARSPLPLLCRGLDSRRASCAVPPPTEPHAHLAVRLGEGDRVAVRAVLSGFSFSATLRIED